MSRIASLIENFCDATDDCRFHADYSGRGMFGRECVGIDIDSLRLSVLIELTEFLISSGIENVSDILGKVCYDNMGKGYILYFPNIQ